MCVIVVLEAGKSIPKLRLYNAVYNNWHSYGLVIRKDEKTFETIKKVPEKEVDPKEVEELLNKYQNFDRYLHLRHMTAGSNTEDNCHPFTVYKDDKREVLFMHNGTMHEYVEKKWENNQLVTVTNGPSDTKNYVNKILIPFITNTDFGDGHGDVKSYEARFLLRKLWPNGNRGLLLTSDDKNPLTLGDWKLIKPIEDKKETHFLASNDDYFSTVSRGPEFDRREAADKAKKKGDKSGGLVRVADISNFQFEVKHDFYTLSESIVDILNDWEFYDRRYAISLGFATKDDLEKLYNSKKDCITVMDWVFTDYANLYDEHEALDIKHEKATKKIAELMNEIKELKQQKAA